MRRLTWSILTVSDSSARMSSSTRLRIAAALFRLAARWCASAFLAADRTQATLGFSL
jgi:hypothetical protein